jgi:hypothetical protein
MPESSEFLDGIEQGMAIIRTVERTNNPSPDGD